MNRKKQVGEVSPSKDFKALTVIENDIQSLNTCNRVLSSADTEFYEKESAALFFLSGGVVVKT